MHNRNEGRTIFSNLDAGFPTIAVSVSGDGSPRLGAQDRCFQMVVGSVSFSSAFVCIFHSSVIQRVATSG